MKRSFFEIIRCTPLKDKSTISISNGLMKRKESILMFPLHFIGEENSPAVKMAGGLISHILNDVEISCLPKDLPSFIEIDLSDLEIGNSLHISQLSFPDGVDPVLHGQDDPVVVTAIKPKGGSRRG